MLHEICLHSDFHAASFFYCVFLHHHKTPVSCPNDAYRPNDNVGYVQRGVCIRGRVVYSAHKNK